MNLLKMLYSLSLINILTYSFKIKVFGTNRKKGVLNIFALLCFFFYNILMSASDVNETTEPLAFENKELSDSNLDKQYLNIKPSENAVNPTYTHVTENVIYFKYSFGDIKSKSEDMNSLTTCRSVHNNQEIIEEKNSLEVVSETSSSTENWFSMSTEVSELTEESNYFKHINLYGNSCSSDEQECELYNRSEEVNILDDEHLSQGTNITEDSSLFIKAYNFITRTLKNLYFKKYNFENILEKELDMHVQLTSKQNELVKIYCSNFLTDISSNFCDSNLKYLYFRKNIEFKSKYNFDHNTTACEILKHFLASEYFDLFYTEGGLFYLEELLEDYIQFNEVQCEFYSSLYGNLDTIKRLFSKKDHIIKNEINTFLNQLNFIIKKSKSDFGVIEIKLKNICEEFKKHQKETIDFSESKQILKERLENYISEENDSKFDFRIVEQVLYELYLTFKSKITDIYLHEISYSFWLFSDFKELFDNKYFFVMFSFETNFENFNNKLKIILENFFNTKNERVLDDFFELYLKTLTCAKKNVGNFTTIVSDINTENNEGIKLSKEDYLTLIHIALENYNFLFFFEVINDSFLDIFVKLFKKYKFHDKTWCKKKENRIQERFEEDVRNGKIEYSFKRPLNYFAADDSGNPDIKFYLPLSVQHICDKNCIDHLLLQKIEKYLSDASALHKSIEKTVKKCLINILTKNEDDENKLLEINLMFLRAFEEKKKKIMEAFAN